MSEDRRPVCLISLSMAALGAEEMAGNQRHKLGEALQEDSAYSAVSVSQDYVLLLFYADVRRNTNLPVLVILHYFVYVRYSL